MLPVRLITLMLYFSSIRKNFLLSFCRRDADFEVRQKRQMQYVDIPSIPFKPSLVIVDNSMPRSVRSEMGKLLAEYSFTALSTVGSKLGPIASIVHV